MKEFAFLLGEIELLEPVLSASVAPLIGISPAAASVIEGQQLTLPCALLAGNPIPERQWVKNSAMVRTL